MSEPNPLVIVIGAGASSEVEFPVGSELKGSIAYHLDFGANRNGRDQRIQECCYKLSQARGTSHSTFDDYHRAARKIREAIPLAPSIDNFVDSHRGDTHIAQIAKLSIAARILEAEQRSALYVDTSNSRNTMDFKRLSGTWFSQLFILLSENCTHEEFAERISRIAIVSFNYDRCFEQFIHQALMTYYTLPPTKAAEIASAVTIFHPYGSVGPMPFETSASSVAFGAQLYSDELLRSAKSIKTFTESTEDTEYEITAIRECVAKAKALVYLGFAFHPLNMKLLYGTAHPPEKGRSCDVFATAYGISDSNAYQIAHDLTVMGGYQSQQVRLHQNLKANSLVSEYSRLLAAILRGTDNL